MSWLRHDLDDIPAMQLMPQGDHAPVDLRAYAGVPDFGVHRVGEIDGRGIPRQHHHFSFGREDIHLFGIQIDFQRG